LFSQVTSPTAAAWTYAQLTGSKADETARAERTHLQGGNRRYLRRSSLYDSDRL